MRGWLWWEKTVTRGHWSPAPAFCNFITCKLCVCVFASLFSSSLSVSLVTCKQETWIIYSCCRVLVNLSSHIYTHLRAVAIILLRCIRSVTWLSSTSQHAMAREENTATRSETTKRTKKLDWILCTALPRRAEVQQCSENWNIETERRLLSLSWDET